MTPDLKTAKRATNRWSRLVHVYTSMIAFVLVLFFGITGVTLNHPDWSIGSQSTGLTKTGTLPMAPATGDGSPDYLSVSEYMRDEFGVSGAVEGYDATNGQATIRYRNPGYSADVTFSLTTGEFQLVTEQQGFLFGVINDLHKGRHAGTSWKWLIDVAGLLLVVISFSGIVMQLFLRRRRTSAFIVAGVGGIVMLLLIWMTLG